MTDFYKMDPSDWDFGTANLTLEEEAAYLRIVNAIHKHKGPVPDIDRVLAGMFRTSTRKARSLVQALLDAGKITIEDGKIWNDRARSDLVRRGFVSISRAESGAKGGRTRAANVSKALENNNAPQANASSREEKRREENTVAKATVVHSDFEAFWNAYPHRDGKRGRKLAETKFAAAVKRGINPETIIAGAIRAQADRRVLQGYARDPTTWLNQAGWEDETETTPAPPKGNPNERRAFDQATAAVAVGLSQGSITLDHSSRDPFAVRPGRDTQADQYGVIPLFRS